MKYYDPFDCEINCEELLKVSEEEFNAVMQEIAAERVSLQSYEEYLTSLEVTERQAVLEQQAFERREAKRKDWPNGYSNKQDGFFYGGIAI